MTSENAFFSVKEIAFIKYCKSENQDSDVRKLSDDILSHVNVNNEIDVPLSDLKPFDSNFYENLNQKLVVLIRQKIEHQCSITAFLKIKIAKLAGKFVQNVFM